MTRWGRKSKLERQLHAARPQAPESLVRRLAASVEPAPRRARAPRIALAGFASAVMLVGLAAVGGVGHAANEIAHIASVATGHTNYFGTKLAVSVNTSSAANDQYGGQETSDKTKHERTKEHESGSLAVNPGHGQRRHQLGRGTFGSQQVDVHADPAPPNVTSASLFSGKDGANQITSIIVTDSSGNVVHDLAAPLEIVFANPPKGFRPSVSTDGVNFRELTKLTGTTLPDGQKDGYFVASDGSIHILTMHLTIFAVLYSANITTSESGRTTPRAGSGAFGDPTRNHTGAPVLRQVGAKITPTATSHVPFDFSVDEQAATYISIYDAKGNPVWIERKGTTVRGHEYTGTPVHTLHLVIKRPGLIKTLLKVAPGELQSGKTYKIRITSVDFDGHKVTRYTTFTA